MILHLYLCDRPRRERVFKVLIDNDIPGFFSKIESACNDIREGGDWQKRKRLEEEFPSPSEAGKNYREWLPRVLSHRPPGRNGLHVGLQVKAFGQFMNVQIPPDYYELALELMQVMSKLFDNEGSRQAAFCDKLERRIFFPLKWHHVTKVGKVIPDLCILGPNDETLVNFEFKNDMTNISSEPLAQNIACFIKLQ